MLGCVLTWTSALLLDILLHIAHLPPFVLVEAA